MDIDDVAEVARGGLLVQTEVRDEPGDRNSPSLAKA